MDSNPILANKVSYEPWSHNLSKDIDILIPTPAPTFKYRVNNYMGHWGSPAMGGLNTAIGAAADLAGGLINHNGLSTGAGNIMSGIGNVVGNIPGPIGWAGKGLALAGLAVNALWGHKFNDANVATAENANANRNNFLFGDYSNTASLLAGSLSNVLLDNVNKGFLGKEGPFSDAVTNKMKLINNDRMMANLRANNSELNAYNNYLTGVIRNAIAGDNMGNVNSAAAGGPLNMLGALMTPFGNRYFDKGGYTHGSLFTNGFVKINNGGSHELNPNEGVQYGMDEQGTPNMVEEGETILDNYVFSDRIKFPKKYKDEFALGGKIWKKSFADVSKMIAKESEERPNDPISQRSLKAMGGKLADIQEEVKAKQLLNKLDPRLVVAMLQQLAMMLQGEQGEQDMLNPYEQLAMMGMEEQPIMAACGGKLHAYGGNLFAGGGNTNNDISAIDNPLYDLQNEYGMPLFNLEDYVNEMMDPRVYRRRRSSRRSSSSSSSSSKPAEQKPTEPAVQQLSNRNFGFLKDVPESLQNQWNTTVYTDKRLVMLLLYRYLDAGIISPDYAMRIAYMVTTDTYPTLEQLDGIKKGLKPSEFLKNALSGKGQGLEYLVDKRDKDGKVVTDKNGVPLKEKKTDPWFGNDLYNYAYGRESYTSPISNAGTDDKFTLSRGFDGSEDLRSLNYDYDPSTVNEEEAKQYLLDYASTNPSVVLPYLNAKLAADKDLARSYWDAWAELPDDIDYDSEQYAGIQAVNPESEEFRLLEDGNEKNVAAYKFYKQFFDGSEKNQKFYKEFEKEAQDAADKEQRDEELRLNLEDIPTLYTGTRYAPLAFSSVATLLDNLGITNRADLAPYNTLLGQSSELGKTIPVRYNPVFQPMVYRPVNTNADILQANNLFASTSRNVNNSSLGNVGAAMAGNIVALNQAGLNIGKLRDALVNADIRNQQGVSEFNNKGAYQDSMSALEAEKVNTNNVQNAQRFGYQALNDALKYYQAEQQAANAAKQVNLTHAVNSWANVGRENMYMNMINSNKAFDYWIRNNGISGYKYSSNT